LQFFSLNQPAIVAGSDTLHAELLHSAVLATAEISKAANSTFAVLFRSTRSGLFRLRATVNAVAIVNLIPSAVNISAGQTDASTIGTSGLSPDMPFVAGVPGSFALIARDAHSNRVTIGGGKFLVDVENNDHVQAVVSIVDRSDGTYNVSVLATVAGMYTATIRHGGKDILNSPFQVRFSPAGACVAPALQFCARPGRFRSCLMSAIPITVCTCVGPALVPPVHCEHQSLRRHLVR
jgi:hypothetical protein